MSPIASPPLDARVVETHSSVLFFVGDRVHKLKKPVDLGFLDFSTREARHDACHLEVALNRRLAPDAYLGVEDLIGVDGEPIDHLVAMRRMPDDRRLSRCVERGDDVSDALRQIAHLVAALHDATGPDARHDQLATLSAVRARWVAGFDALREVSAPAPYAERNERIEHLVHRYLDGRSELLGNRIRRGWIRDGHGDLQAEDIFLLDEGPQILDCLEFCEDLRWGDVLSDVAFLAMDLERLGRPDLGRAFLALHREHSADRWPDSLAHLYVAYRAHIRAKVGVLRAQQAGTPIETETHQLFDLARDHLEQGRVRLVVVAGAPGTGKSTVAAELGDRLGAVVLRTDELRQRSSAPNRYDDAAIAETYRQMVAEARRLLSLGEHVVLDATFGDADHRLAVRRAATDTCSDLTELRCTLPIDLAEARVAARLAEGRDASEATPAIARSLAASFDPWPQAEVLDTRAAPAEVVDRAAAAVG